MSEEATQPLRILRRRKRWPWVLGGIAVILVLTLAVVTFHRLVLTKPQATENIPASAPREIGDSGVRVSGVAVPRDITAAVDANVKLPYDSKNVVSRSPVYRITSEETGKDGKLAQPVTLYFPVTNGPIVDPNALLVATTETPDGAWSPPMRPQLSADGKYIVVTTPHLSWWNPMEILGKVFDAFSKDSVAAFLGNATATGMQPVCEGESAAKKDGYSPVRKGKAIKACLGIKDGERFVEVASQVPYYLDLKYNANLTPVDSKFHADAAQLAKSLSGKNRTVLYPFETMRFKVASLKDNGLAGLEVEYSGTGGAMAQLQFGFETAISVAVNLRLLDGGNVIVKAGTKLANRTEVLKRLSSAFAAAGCADVLLNDSGNPGAIINKCLVPLIDSQRDVLALVGIAAIATMAGFAAFFRGAFKSIIDIVKQDDKSSMTVTRIVDETEANYKRFVGKYVWPGEEGGREWSLKFASDKVITEKVWILSCSSILQSECYYVTKYKLESATEKSVTGKVYDWYMEFPSGERCDACDPNPSDNSETFGHLVTFQYDGEGFRSDGVVYVGPQ